MRRRKKIAESVRLMCRRDFVIDHDPRKHANSLEHAERVFQRTLARTTEADRRSRMNDPVIRPSHPVDQAHEILQFAGGARFLLALYDIEIEAALKAKDAELALLLGIQCGQIAQGLAVSEIARRGGRFTVVQRKRVTRKKTHGEVAESYFNYYVHWSLQCYREDQCEKGEHATWNGFREYMREISKKLLASKDAWFRAVGKRLLGKAGKESDGFMCARSLIRAVQEYESTLKNS
jgi:hypothetical protein